MRTQYTIQLDKSNGWLHMQIVGVQLESDSHVAALHLQHHTRHAKSTLQADAFNRYLQVSLELGNKHRCICSMVLESFPPMMGGFSKHE